MKKTLFVSLSFLLFSVIPSFAQNTQQKANEINDAGTTAVQSEFATEARNINDEAWAGANEGGGTPNVDGGNVDIIGGNNDDSRTQDTPSTFDQPETENVTPWLTEVYAMLGLLGGAFVLMLILSLLVQATCAKNNPIPAKIAIVLASIATAMCAAALALSIVLMVKYGQKELGITWAIASTLAMTSCLVAVYAGVSAFRGAMTDTYSFLAANFAVIGCVGLACCVIGAPLGYALVKSSNTADKEFVEYCQTHPDYKGCEGFAVEEE